MKFLQTGEFVGAGGWPHGGSRATVNRVVVLGAPATSFEANGMVPIGPRRCIAQVYGPGVTGANLVAWPDGEVLAPRGANVIVGNPVSGVWAAAVDPGPGEPGGMFCSTGFSLPAGWGPVAVADNGDILYRPHAGFPIRVRRFGTPNDQPVASDEILTHEFWSTARAYQTGFQAVVGRRVPGLGSELRGLGMAVAVGLPTWFSGYVQERDWCAYQDEARTAVLVRRLSDPSRARVIPAPLAWGLDLRVTEQLELVFARTEGEHPDSQEHVAIAVDELVPLGPVVVEPPPPPPPPPPPDREPTPMTYGQYRSFFDAHWGPMRERSRALALQFNYTKQEQLEADDRAGVQRAKQLVAELRHLQAGEFHRLLGVLHHTEGHRDVGAGTKTGGINFEGKAEDVMLLKPIDASGRVVADAPLLQYDVIGALGGIDPTVSYNQQERNEERQFVVPTAPAGSFDPDPDGPDEPEPPARAELQPAIAMLAQAGMQILAAQGALRRLPPIEHPPCPPCELPHNPACDRPHDGVLLSADYPAALEIGRQCNKAYRDAQRERGVRSPQNLDGEFAFHLAWGVITEGKTLETAIAEARERGR